MKEDLIKRLVETFKEETKKYSDILDGVVDYKCEEFYKKNNPEKGYHSVDACIMFKTFTLKLEYKINVSMFIPKSTIEMRFMFENGKLPVEYSIYDLFNIIDKNNFKCYTFGYVTSKEKVKEILKYLIDAFKKYKEKIEDLSTNAEQIVNLEQSIESKIKTLLNEDVFKSRDAFYLMHMLELYYVLDVSRFTTDAYLNYLSGKNKKALKKYKKLGERITSYEKRLMEHLQKENTPKPVKDKLNTLEKAKKLKNPTKELVPMYLSWIILTPIWLIVYAAIFYIASYFLTKGAIYVGGEQPYMLFLPAFITAIINSYFTRKIIYKILFKKNYKDIVALDEIENTGKIEAFMSKLFQFIIAASLVFTVLTANSNIIFYEDTFKNNLDFLDLKGETINYEDVSCVYKAKGIISDFNQIVENPTYVIILKDNRQISLYDYMEFEDIKENIIPIFEKHNIEIKEIDLVNNIIAMYNTLSEKEKSKFLALVNSDKEIISG